MNDLETVDEINQTQFHYNSNPVQDSKNNRHNTFQRSFFTYSTIPNFIKCMELFTFFVLVISGSIKLVNVEHIITITSSYIYIILFIVLLYNVIDVDILVGVRENNIDRLLSNIFCVIEKRWEGYTQRITIFYD